MERAMAGVRVRFLGSGDAFGSGGRLQTCIYVEAAERFLIDCGASSLVALKRFGVDAAEIGAILVSHLHGDHFGGIPFFVLDAQFSRRERPLLIAGPPRIQERVQQAMEVFFPGSSQTRQRFSIRFLEHADRTPSTLGGLTLTPFEVDHASGAPAFALRVECGGRTIAYSGDTAWAPALLDAANDADVFICEAYFFEKQVPYHLDYRTLAQQRAALRCRRLVLTHMSADMLAQLAGLDVEAAEDGLTLSL